MNGAPFRLELLGEDHDRSLFCCGVDALDRYFRTQATQDFRRRVANCYVAIEAKTGSIAAFYTLSSACITLTDLPAQEAKRLPRYPTLPAVRIGRLGVDQRFRGQGLGAALLADAVQRTLNAPAAAFALLVDAKHDNAVAFYRHFGFRSLASRPQSLFLPLETCRLASLKR